MLDNSPTEFTHCFHCNRVTISKELIKKCKGNLMTAKCPYCGAGCFDLRGTDSNIFMYAMIDDDKLYEGCVVDPYDYRQFQVTDEDYIKSNQKHFDLLK